MTDTTLAPARATGWQPGLFVVTVFTSAGLVFMVQPMVAKLVLPTLGGTPAVWNTSMAFFQTALLFGYLYAHLLQRISSIRIQVIVHLVMLVAAAIVLPLQIRNVVGDPTQTHPALWLLGVLAVSIGPPFAVLSATAPLIQAWYARVFEREDDSEPYALYAASNLGSLLALVAYPIIVEPTLTLQAQRFSWSGGYLTFILIMAAVAFFIWRKGELVRPASVAAAPPSSPAATARGWFDRAAWLDRGAWVFLAAVPSSLMLGVTTYITTDVGSAPFLWVGPLALYLLTFVIAFQQKPLIGRETNLIFQGAFVAGAIVILPFSAGQFILELFLQLTAFFLTALMCHQALVARRPPPERLTEFYLFMSLGGVVGGSFNAFLAPVIFNTVIEYPLVLVLSCLARPWGDGGAKRWEWAALVASALLAVSAVWMLTTEFWNLWWRVTQIDITNSINTMVKVPLALATVFAFILRRRAFPFMAALIVLVVASQTVGERTHVLHNWRSFFGVLRESQMDIPGLDGPRQPGQRPNYVHMLAHGTTLHGAQATWPAYRCQPLVYYAHETPIGQVFDTLQAQRPAVRIGAVGLGTGSVAAYVRPNDRLTFFEIDPLVIRVAHTERRFTYTTECARGPVDFVVGDARLTLEREPPGQYDILLIDAFSSDAVPAHLLTVEAIRMYLTRLKPDGILILHLSNRHLNLRGPAMAGARAAGGYPLMQLHRYEADKDGLPVNPPMWESAEHAVIVARTPEALARFRSNPAWRTREVTEGRPWTDDYTNLFGALVARLQDQAARRE